MLVTRQIYSTFSGKLRLKYPTLTEDEHAEILHFGLTGAEYSYSEGEGSSFPSWCWIKLMWRAKTLFRDKRDKTLSGNERLRGKWFSKEFTASEDYFDFDLFDPGPDPLEALVLKEEQHQAEALLERILKLFDSEDARDLKRKIVKLKLAGLTLAEVSDRLGMKLANVDYHMRGLRSRWPEVSSMVRTTKACTRSRASGR